MQYVYVKKTHNMGRIDQSQINGVLVQFKMYYNGRL